MELLRFGELLAQDEADIPASMATSRDGGSFLVPKAKSAVDRNEVRHKAGQKLVDRINELTDKAEAQHAMAEWKIRYIRRLMQHPVTPDVLINVAEAYEGLERGIHAHGDAWALTDEGFRQLMKLKAARDELSTIGKKGKSARKRVMTAEEQEEMREHLRENPDELKEKLKLLGEKLGMAGDAQ